MADLSSFTHKWRATPTGLHQSEGNKVNKRNRQPVSCAPCRNRKLKCDRGHPCDACLKRNDEESCVYGKTTATTIAPRRDDSKTHMKAQERLRHLEDLVKQMIGPDKVLSTPRTPPADDHQRPPEGSLNKDASGTSYSYTGSTHWATVLDQIHELRNTLSPNSLSEEDHHLEDEVKPESLFGGPQPPPLHILLQKYLPPREECNRYLSTYFNAKYMTVPFIHTQQFKRQYEHFWEHQMETSPIWISILFSIMCLADGIRQAPLSLYRPNSDRPRTRSTLLIASAQCLVHGNYSKAQPYVVEALAMHSQCKYAVSLDPSHELGLIFSVLTRQAFTMGYHRDPSNFGSQFTVFESEMRRRCWSLLKQFDIMVSFQLGLPMIIQPDSWDTQLPSHLLDEDFDENTMVLPPPRPDTQPTQVLYLITKARMMEIYSKICSHSLSFPKQPFTAADITSLDALITQAVESIPQILQARPMTFSYADPTNLTMTRSNLMFLGEKARVTLHRKYMVTGPNAAVSRAKCIASSSRTIRHFLDLHTELQPGGQLYNDRWMLTSFTINDFLLALMVLCLAFSLGRKNFVAGGGDAARWLELDPEAASVFDLLKSAQPVCTEYGNRGKEAKHVAEALGLVLVKLEPKGSGMRNVGRDNPTKEQLDTKEIGGYGGGDGDGDADTMPLDIVPLSIHAREHVYDRQPIHDFNPISIFPTPETGTITSPSFDFSLPTNTTSITDTSQGPLTFSNPMEPSPSSSWELMDGPLPNILDGPEQIDWVQFDQFLWMYSMQGEGEGEIL